MDLRHVVADGGMTTASGSSSLLFNLLAQLTGGPVVDRSDYEFVRLHRDDNHTDSAWGELYNQLCHQGSVLACQYGLPVADLTHLFSTVTCPSCETPYRLSDSLRA